MRAVASIAHAAEPAPFTVIPGNYRELLDAAPDAMVVVVSEAGDIVLLNMQAERQFGYR